MKRKIKSDSGFTLAELLIVVAIIGVLVAIAIPIFTGQLEKSREAVDLSDVRSAYAEVMMAAITGDTSAMYTKDSSTIYDSQKNVYTITVSPLKQQKDGWDTPLPIMIGGVSSNDKVHWVGKPGANGQCKIVYTPAQGTEEDFVTFYWEGGSQDGDNNSGGTDNGSGTTTPDEPGTAPDKKPTNIGGHFDAMVAEYPTGEFVGNLGDLYSYKGKIYICNSAQKYNAGGSPSMEEDGWYQWCFLELSSSPTILTKDDLKTPYEGSQKEVLQKVNYGDWYRSGNDYYICIGGASDLDPPNESNIKTSEHNWGNWLKIPTIVSGNYGE